MGSTLVDIDLKDFINRNYIVSSRDLNEYIQPASIDLPLSETAFLVKEKTLPFNKKISEIIKTNLIQEISLKDGAILLKGQTYLVPCITVNLPHKHHATISPKSSIGRIDLMVRAIFDNSGLYDRIPENKAGQLWLEITPQSFNVKVKAGIALNQIRIFNGLIEKIDISKEHIAFDKTGKVLRNKICNQDLMLSLNVPKNDIFGYEAIETNEVIDISKISEYNPKRFFREIKSFENSKFILEKDKFYIVTTKEYIRIPEYLSAEMVPFSHLLGELRVHYAGFFDPGFGNNKGNIGVLEIRPHETITVFDGQPICLMEYFKNSQMPESLYGKYGNNYAKQTTPKLSKYFKLE